MPTGYSLPHDTPLIKQAKLNTVVSSNVSLPHAWIEQIFFASGNLMSLNHTLLFLSLQVKYKEAYEMVKAKGYTLHPEGVNFVTARKANKIINEVR